MSNLTASQPLMVQHEVMSFHWWWCC